MIKDTHLAALDAGLLCASAYRQNAPDMLVHRTAKGIVAAIGNKGPSATRAGTKEKAREVALLCVKAANTGETFLDSLTGIWEKAKQPKLIATCVGTMTDAIKGFGREVAPPSKTPQPLPPGMVIDASPMIKVLPKHFALADKNMRAEADKLVVEIQRWVGEGVLSALNDLKEMQLKQIKEAIRKWKGSGDIKVIPARMTRQQRREFEAGIVVEPTPGLGEGEEEPDAGATMTSAAHSEIHPWGMAGPVDILSKIQKDTLDALTTPKWSERRDALNEPAEITGVTRIKSVRYGKLVAVVAKRVGLDAHIMCVSKAAKVIANLAKGLRKDFSSYRSQTLPVILGKC